jgi:DMSO/TMAO reductase YedYZ molybdopterin-dependent catalytic subunit
MIVREHEPQNLEFPLGSLDGFRVPTEHFYVRNHFAMPSIDPKAWRLKVEGAVERPLELTLDELKKLGEKTFPCTLECAGNGRVFLVPKVRGVPWALGAVGNAEWTGVPLAAVLERAGVKKSAVEVVLEGADTGTINDDPKSPGPIAFARGLPLEKACKPEVLLAYGMNGAGLTRAHGAPLRAVVGGWYGMASVKWLGRIVVTDKPFQGFFQSLDYTFFERQSGLPSVVPVTGMQVKASIARPVADEAVPRGRPYRVTGAAWAGEADVAKVEVSADGGKTWQAAKLLGEAVPFAWRLWEFDWRVPDGPGRAALIARATDSQGRAQPEKRDPDRRTYMINHLVPVEVEIR